MNVDSPISVESPIMEDEENGTIRTKINSNAFKQETLNCKSEKS